MVSDGALIHSLNMVSMPYGAKSKRAGYNAFLDTTVGGTVNSLQLMPNIKNTGSIAIIAAAGSLLYSSSQGTANWVPMGNGTIANNARFNTAYFGTILTGGDGVGSTRYTTDGTSFTNTTGAPVSQYFAQYHNRIYVGSANTETYSVTNDATNWQISGTADSSSFQVNGEGTISSLFVAGDRLVTTKSKGKMYNWDDYNLVDMSTHYGPSSHWSVAQIEDYRFWLNQYGMFGFDGVNAQLLSNPVQRLFYNRANTGIAGSVLGSVPAIAHYYDYYASIGSVQDDFTRRGVNNAILNYNYQKNEFLLHQFNDFPTAWLSYNDATNKRQLIFGSGSGKVFQTDATATTDNGAVINCELVQMFVYASNSASLTPTSQTSVSASSYQKKWNWVRLFFNPGCEANIQFAVSDSFTYDQLSWIDIVDPSPNTQNIGGDGIVEYRFPQGTRGRVLFLRIYEASPNSAWTYYGCQIDAEPQIIA